MGMLKCYMGCSCISIADGLHKAQTATKVLFGGDLGSVTGEEIVQAFKDDSSRLVQLDRNQVIGSGLDGIATLAKATKSKCKLHVARFPEIPFNIAIVVLADAQKRIKAGGLYLNNARVADPRYKVAESDLLDGQVCVIRCGKSSYHLVHVV